MKRKNSMAVGLLLFAFGAHAQTISTVAGNGTGGYMGDGGAATSAELSTPIGVSTDASGNYYISDQHNNCIRKVTSSGTITTFAGSPTFGFSGDGGAATAAELYQPYRTAVDGSGNVYIIDAGNNRIRNMYFAQTNEEIVRKIDATGIISLYAGNGSMGFSGDGGAATSAEFTFPSGVALDGSGNLYIADQNNNRIRKITSTTTGIMQPYPSSNDISVFPNPNSVTFTITGSLNSTDETVSMIVLDMLGQVVYNKDVATPKGILNTQVTLPGIGSGIYFLKICSENQSTTYRVMIEK